MNKKEHSSHPKRSFNRAWKRTPKKNSRKNSHNTHSMDVWQVRSAAKWKKAADKTQKRHSRMEAQVPNDRGSGSERTWTQDEKKTPPSVRLCVHLYGDRITCSSINHSLIRTVPLMQVPAIALSHSFFLTLPIAVVVLKLCCCSLPSPPIAVVVMTRDARTFHAEVMPKPQFSSMWCCVWLTRACVCVFLCFVVDFSLLRLSVQTLYTLYSWCAVFFSRRARPISLTLSLYAHWNALRSIFILISPFDMNYKCFFCECAHRSDTHTHIRRRWTKPDFPLRLRLATFT